MHVVYRTDCSNESLDHHTPLGASDLYIYIQYHTPVAVIDPEKVTIMRIIIISGFQATNFNIEGEGKVNLGGYCKREVLRVIIITLFHLSGGLSSTGRQTPF